MPAKESTKREAREASGDDLHSALGRSSAKDAVAPLTASKAMAKKPEVRLRSAAACCEPGRRPFQDATGCFDSGRVPGDVLQQGAHQTG